MPTNYNTAATETALSTHKPNICSEANTSNNAVPKTKNEAKKVISTFVFNHFGKKIKVINIDINDLPKFFNHEDGGKYYLKDHFHNSEDELKKYISNNKEILSFMK